MKLDINDQRKISTIQEEFNTVFPYLKLEFFFNKNNPRGILSKGYIKQYNKPLHECRTVQNKKQIVITPEMTVINLEQSFREVYGLVVEVFRKSGKVWLETTVTDGWTLEEQNTQGEALSKIPI